MTLSVGDQLRQAREARKLSLEQVAQATRIRYWYLQALEAEEYEQLPSITQARGFLHTYAQYLHLDPEPLLSALRDDGASPSATPQEIVDTAPVVNPLAEQAEAIFVEIGTNLRRQREVLGLSLEDIERHTHLRKHYLEALESGNLAGLPSPVQGRGMLNNYAVFLGLDPEPVLLRFAEGLQAGLAARQAARARTAPVKPRRVAFRLPFLRNLLSVDLLVGGLLVIFIGSFVIWGTLRVVSVRSNQQPSVTAPSIADVLTISIVTPSLTPTDLLTPASVNVTLTQESAQTGPDLTETASPQETLLAIDLSQPTGTATFPPFSASAVQLYIVVRQRAWMRVTVDGKEEFSGRVVPGSAYLFNGREQVEILTGNGAALNVYFNQQDMGTLGILGEVVYRVYTPAGVVAPSPTSTLTSTPTPTPSPTLISTEEFLP